ncbi:MAG: MCE family protein [Candidatus Omnitrophica bacterium]|nr:MCE family protein [Candidatus Omnitrophota bacterium]
MSKKANKTAIGLFVVVALALLVIALSIFGSGALFKRTYKYILYFDGSVKGLSVGAPVLFRGVRIGTVKDISLLYEEKAEDVLLTVVIEIEPGHVKGAPKMEDYGGYKTLIEYGLRAKLEIQSFITNQLMISLDFYRDKPAKLYNIYSKYPELPTLPISPDIFETMDELPLKEISDNLDDVVKGLSKLINSTDLQRSLYELKNTLSEVKQAARSFRMLTEYLEQHPEAILKGKPAIKGD